MAHIYTCQLDSAAAWKHGCVCFVVLCTVSIKERDSAAAWQQSELLVAVAHNICVFCLAPQQHCNVTAYAYCTTCLLKWLVSRFLSCMATQLHCQLAWPIVEACLFIELHINCAVVLSTWQQSCKLLHSLVECGSMGSQQSCTVALKETLVSLPLASLHAVKRSPQAIIMCVKKHQNGLAGLVNCMRIIGFEDLDRPQHKCWFHHNTGSNPCQMFLVSPNFCFALEPFQYTFSSFCSIQYIVI